MKWQFELSDCPTNTNYPIVAYQVNDSGVKKGPFHIGIEDFIKALQSQPDNLLDADGARLDELSTPALPIGTIRYSANESRSRQRVTMEIPQKQWDIRYGNDMNEFFTIGFPRMIVQYLVITHGTTQVIREMRIYAALNDGKPITDHTQLYTFPYPNVGKDNAIVCWGQNQRLEVESLVDLEHSFRWFVSAPFNEDHGARTTIGISNFRKLIDKIEDKPFDDEWLVPSKKTYGELFFN